LFVPIILFRFLQRALTREEKCETSDHGTPDLFMPSGLVNRLLVWVLTLEAGLLRLFDLPFGVGIVVLAKRPEVLQRGLERR
jgi:hypothetical protein